MLLFFNFDRSRMEEERECKNCHQIKPLHCFNYSGLRARALLPQLRLGGGLKSTRPCNDCFVERKRKTQKEIMKRSASNRNLINIVASQLLRSARVRVQKRKAGKVTLSTKWIADILRIGYCQESFPPLRLVLDKPGSPFAPSLDRIDSSNYDYSPSNVLVSCRGINQARSNYNDREILTITESLSRYIKRRRNSI